MNYPVFSRCLAVVALLVFQGCIPTANFPLQDIGYAERIRLDRQSMGTLAEQDMEFGLYSDGLAADGADNRLVSELYISNVSGPRMSNLPLSNCLWLATDSDGRSGDSLSMSWEGMATFRIEDEVTPSPLRMCRLTDELGVYTGVSVGGSTQALTGHHLGWNVNAPMGTGSPSGSDLMLLGTILSAHGDPEPDPYGRCPVGPGLFENTYPDPADAVVQGKRFSWSGTEIHVPRDPSYGCPDRADNHGETTLCGKRCSYRPPASVRDALSLRLGFVDELDFKSGDLDITLVPENRSPRWMKPNLLLARDTRTIARPMRRVGSGSSYTYEWKTPVAGAPTNPTLQRWHENFSPNVTVAAVRFFRLEPGSNEETALDDVNGDGISDIADNRVVLRQMNTFLPCEGNSFEGIRSFAVRDCIVATPTYLHELLQDELGHPLT